MADNILLNAGTGGSTLATDDDTTAHHQYVKVEFGPDNTQTKVSLTDGMPIQNETGGSITVDLGANNDVVASNAGTFVVQENGAALTALQLLDNAVSGSGYNISQLGGVNVNMGEGIIATGTQRVTLATDDDGVAHLATIAGAVSTQMQVDVVAALPAGTNAIGKLAANSGVDIGDVDVLSSALPTGAATSANQLPATSGGISTVFRDEDIDETAVVCKSSAGQVYWIHCINLDATPVYLHFYDVAQGSVTVGTTGELCSFAVPSQGDANGAGFTMHFNHGIEFSTAITVACTTTIGGTAGPAANEVILNVGYA